MANYKPVLQYEYIKPISSELKFKRKCYYCHDIETNIFQAFDHIAGSIQQFITEEGMVSNEVIPLGKI